MEESIVNTLETVSELARVFDHEPVDLIELPAATLFYSGWSLTDILMPGTQQVSENWVLRIYVKLQDVEAAQTEMKTLVPLIRQAFRKNRNLDGACLYCLFERGTIQAVLDKNEQQLMCEMQLSAITEESAF
jgi:hypothetical protein